MTNPNRGHHKVITPEVIPPRSERGNHAVKYFPKWAIYGGIGATALLAVSTVRTIFPVLCLGLITGLALKKARKP